MVIAIFRLSESEAVAAHPPELGISISSGFNT
jgi:hypothetical protein